ncbi:MAG: hypothetical protein AAF959_10805 [Cyanobacteria bacterium P01_D01_bin.56]
MNQTPTLSAPQIRKQLDDWCIPNSILPSKTKLLEIQGDWNLIKEKTPQWYWGVIEDRLALVKSKFVRACK